MRLARATLKAGIESVTFRLFYTKEAYLEHQDGLLTEAYEDFTLTSEEFMELEWMGCEFVNDVKLILLRVGVTSYADPYGYNGVKIYYGLIQSDLLNVSELQTDQIKVTLIKKEETLFDLEQLFADFTV